MTAGTQPGDRLAVNNNLPALCVSIYQSRGSKPHAEGVFVIDSACASTGSSVQTWRIKQQVLRYFTQPRGCRDRNIVLNKVVGAVMPEPLGRLPGCQGSKENDDRRDRCVDLPRVQRHL